MAWADVSGKPPTFTPDVSAIADGSLTIAKTSGLQTALDSKALLNGPLRVACVGTSITNQSSTLVTDNLPRITDLTNGHAGWLEHLSNHRVRLMRRNGTYETATDKTFGYAGAKVGGLTDGVANYGVYPLDNAIKSGAEILVVEGGTNDVPDGSAAAITAITAYWTKAVASGKKVIALNVPPTGGVITDANLMVNGNTYEISTPGNTTWTSYGAADNNTGTVFVKSGGTASGTGRALDKTVAAAATTKNTITTINAALPAIASSLGVTLIDIHTSAVLSSGLATTESLWDGTHPTPAYAHRIAKLIDAQLAASYANRPQEFIVPNDSSGLWISTNPSPHQGTAPTGYSLAWATAAWASVTDADGTTWQRCTLTQSQAAYTEDQVYIRTTSGFTAGDKVRFCVRIRPSTGATGYVDVREISALAVFSGGGTIYATAISGGTNTGTGKYDPMTGLFVSPEVTIPSGTTTIDARLGFANGAASACGFEFRQFGVFKVVSNP